MIAQFDAQPQNQVNFGTNECSTSKIQVVLILSKVLTMP